MRNRRPLANICALSHIGRQSTFFAERAVTPPTHRQKSVVMVYRAASLVVMATVVLRAIALAPAAGAEGAQSSVMFASSDDLMHCLAVRWSVDGGDAPLFVADCPLARQNASQASRGVSECVCVF